MKKYYYFIFLIFYCYSCSILEPALGVCNGETDPLNNLEWMRDIVSQNKENVLLVTEIKAKQYLYEDTICVNLDEMFYGYQIFYKDGDYLASITCNNIHSYDCQGKLLCTGCSENFSYLDENEYQCLIYVGEVLHNIIYENVSARDEWYLKQYFN